MAGGAKTKITAAVVAVILIVGATVGIVVGVQKIQRNRNKKEAPSGKMKAVASICAPTEYKDACTRILEPVAARNASATAQDFIAAALQATLDEVKKSSGLSFSLANLTSGDSRQMMALDDCRGFLNSAVESLEEALWAVREADAPSSLEDASFQLRIWMTSVINMKGTCLDQLEIPSLKESFENGMSRSSQLSLNGLSIVSELTQILKAFDLINLSGEAAPHRRLLEQKTAVRKNGGFPKWLPPSSRWLVASLDRRNIRPDAVVAKDGSGQFTTIGEALAAVPSDFGDRHYVIYVKAGVYEEYVNVTRNGVMMYGDGSTKTIVTGDRSYAKGFTTTNTATFAASGHDFICKGMGFRNTAGPAGEQAVALRVKSYRAVFYNCKIEGYQDTLYAQDGPQFYRNCIITGTVDFIFGKGAAVIQNSLIIVRKPGENQRNVIAADGREEDKAIGGIVIHNCRIVAQKRLWPERFAIATYLGRPWKRFSTVLYMESAIPDFVRPEGWMPWLEGAKPANIDLSYLAEYGNTGAGSGTAGRAKWKGCRRNVSRKEALMFTPKNFLEGGADKIHWLQLRGVPFIPGFKSE